MGRHDTCHIYIYIDMYIYIYTYVYDHMPKHGMWRLTAGAPLWAHMLGSHAKWNTSQNQLKTNCSQSLSFYSGRIRLFLCEYWQKKWQLILFMFVVVATVSFARWILSQLRQIVRFTFLLFLQQPQISFPGWIWSIMMKWRDGMKDICVLFYCKQREHLLRVLPAAHMLCSGICLYVYMAVSILL